MYEFLKRKDISFEQLLDRRETEDDGYSNKSYHKTDGVYHDLSLIIADYAATYHVDTRDDELC